MSFKISEVCDINSLNISKNDNLKTINYLDTANLNVGTVDELQYMEVGKDKIPSRAKRIVRKNDILISTVRPNQKHYGIIKNVAKNMVASTGFAVLTPKEDKVDPGYIYNYLIQDHITTYLHSIAESSTSAYPSIKPSVIGDLEVDLPPFEEQKAIAHILSTLDDKIEGNNQINKTLEDMAQEIFRQWFVDFEFPNEDGEPYKSSGGEMIESELGRIPVGWEVRTVDDITAKFTTGLNPRKNFVLGNGNNFYVTIKNMGNQQVFLDDRCDKIDDQALVIINKRSDLRKGDVLFSGIGTIGRTYLIDTIPKNWNISESIFTLRAYDERVSLFLYQLLLSESFQGYAKQLASGSVQKGIRMGDMKIFKLAYSESVVINNYHKIMSSVIDKIKVLQRENIMLSNLRETLLPKLMSGEIRVPMDEEGNLS